MSKSKWLIAIAIFLGIAACASTGNPNEDVVITRPENVKPEVLEQIANNPNMEDPPAVMVDVEEIGNEWALKAVQTFMEDATVVVFTERQFLKEEFKSSKDLSQVINLTIPSVLNKETGETEVDVQGIVTTIGGIVGTVFPPAAPFLPLLGLFPWLLKKRSRVHLKDAVKKAAPTDGIIDMLGAVKSVSKAFGWDHTTDSPEELEKVAKKLRVKIAAKNGNLDNMHATLTGTPVELDATFEKSA